MKVFNRPSTEEWLTVLAAALFVGAVSLATGGGVVQALVGALTVGVLLLLL